MKYKRVSKPVVPNFLDAFPPLLILELFIPPLCNVHSSPDRVRWQKLFVVK